ncbi:MAG: hypothetical protein Q8R96_00915 [Bacteroidota bacterium]|nr:hypothetical protein [Bacteroidota bacterium]
MRNDLQNLLNELDLLRNEAVFFLDEENWKSLVTAETRKKLEKIKPTAIYVFDGNPYILFFDLTDIADPEREQTIHKQVWSFDQAPLAFVLKGSDVKIYNAFAYEKSLKAQGLQEIHLKDGERRKIFSFWNLQSGATWKWLQENYKKKKQNDRAKRVHQKLFDNIKTVREYLKKSNAINDDAANIIILRLIFIRYLIDRNVEINPEFISGKTIVERRISFSDLIKNHEKLTHFFSDLNYIFNGVLFKDDIVLSIDQAEYLSFVFSEKEGFDRPTLFDDFKEFYFSIFDFNIIPVEMISGIYESLIDPETKNADSAFYTPLFIVEHILTNTLDKFFDRVENQNKSECMVFDASMGSGIFLVQAFRRMVDREIELSGKNLSKKRLSEIATKNLWGIDVNPSAIKVACFSVYIAILDYEDPGTIMDQFHFRDLNFQQADFFEIEEKQILNSQIKQIPFEFILGNPPWKKDKSPKHLAWVNKQKIYKEEIIGKIEIAQNFLLRARDFMKENTVCSLIVTSPVFYNILPTSKTFKNEFLTTTNISSILDLSPVRRYIFDGKKVEIDEKTGKRKTKRISNPALIITFKKTDGNFRESVIEHTSVKSNFFTKHYKALVIEKFDRKRILQSHFIDNEWMFKVALYGNALDYRLLRKIEESKTKIIDLIDGKKIFKGTGILKGNITDYKSFQPIIDKHILENEDIKEYYTHKNNPKTITKKESFIKSGKHDHLYDGTQILIKEQAKEESELVISFSKNYVFRKGVFGISSEDSIVITELYGHLISDLYTYYIFSTSCAWGVSTRPQIRLDEEYLSFPFLESNRRDAFITLVNEFLEPIRIHYSQEFTRGNPPINEEAKKVINEIIFQTYQVNGYEKDLIDYVLNVSRYQFQESKINKVIKPVRKNDGIVDAYADVFFSELESIYPNEHISVEVYNLDHFVALNFVFSTEKPIDKIDNKTKGKDEWTILKKISQTASMPQLSKDIFIQKDVKGFEENSFYIIKPNEYKCWHRAMAWYDVAEIKQMIEADELEYLKENPDAI